MWGLGCQCGAEDDGIPKCGVVGLPTLGRGLLGPPSVGFWGANVGQGAMGPPSVGFGRVIVGQGAMGPPSGGLWGAPYLLVDHVGFHCRPSPVPNLSPKDPKIRLGPPHSEPHTAPHTQPHADSRGLTCPTDREGKWDGPKLGVLPWGGVGGCGADLGIFGDILGSGVGDIWGFWGQGWDWGLYVRTFRADLGIFGGFWGQGWDWGRDLGIFGADLGIFGDFGASGIG